MISVFSGITSTRLIKEKRLLYFWYQVTNIVSSLCSWKISASMEEWYEFKFSLDKINYILPGTIPTVNPGTCNEISNIPHSPTENTEGETPISYNNNISTFNNHLLLNSDNNQDPNPQDTEDAIDESKIKSKISKQFFKSSLLSKNYIHDTEFSPSWDTRE